MKISCNNKNLGAIDEHIQEKFYNKEKLYKVKIDNKFYNVSEYKNKFPLILNEVKDLFLIPKIRYDLVSINNKEYFIYQNLGNIALSEYKKHINPRDKPLLFTSVQRLLIFNWLMCINIPDTKIQVFPQNNNYEIIDIEHSTDVWFKNACEKSYRIEDFHIPRVIIDEYFNGSNDEFDTMVKIKVKSINPDLLRNKLLDIVKKYDNEFIYWVNSVYKRFTNLK